MGCGSSSESGGAADAPAVKVLLLGSGGCGKTTFIKQMQLNYEKGFKPEVIEETTKQIQSNILHRISVALSSDKEGLPPIEDNLKEFADLVATAAKAEHEFRNEDGSLDPKVCTALQAIGVSETVKWFKEETYYEAPWDWDFIVPKHLTRIFSPGFKASDMDVLNCRKATTGYHEYYFTIDKNRLLFVDVGGQRKERATWVKAMEAVTAVIFVGSLTDYAVNLEEDSSKNRMDEALDLFERVYHSPKLKTVPTICFLNKTDLFRTLLTKVPLETKFTDYGGTPDYGSCLGYISSKFAERSKAKPSDKQLLTFPVCSTDPDNFMKVFVAIKNILMTSNLIAAGLL